MEFLGKSLVKCPEEPVVEFLIAGRVFRGIPDKIPGGIPVETAESISCKAPGGIPG